MGYDNIHALQKLNEADIKKIENFMQKVFHKLLAKKHQNDEIELKKQMEKHYGIFSCAPEEFVLLGGFEYILLSCSSFASKLNVSNISQSLCLNCAK